MASKILVLFKILLLLLTVHSTASRLVATSSARASSNGRQPLPGDQDGKQLEVWPSTPAPARSTTPSATTTQNALIRLLHKAQASGGLTEQRGGQEVAGASGRREEEEEEKHEEGAFKTSSLSSAVTEKASDETPRAELCYLADGGSSLTLTVNEATQVGAVIGSIEVSDVQFIEQVARE